MRWRKLGRVFAAERQYDWMPSHAANPVAEQRGDDEYRIYFGCRDRQNRTHIAYVDIEIDERVRVLRVADEPVLRPGEPGLFDDSGTSMGCIVLDGDRCLLYYVGWNLGVTVPWRNSIGLAMRTGRDGRFEKVFQAPVLDRSHEDPFSLSYPCVLRDGGRWRMWYGSNLMWGPNQSDMRHAIKYSESDDGIHWRRDGLVVLDFAAADEYALCRPWVIRDETRYRMWFCHRGDAYHIGYAESADGLHWERGDNNVVEASASGWDAEMTAYPSLFQHRGRWYMLYNGNGYGRTGFGIAVAE